MRIVGYILVFVHLFLFFWAVGGFLEMLPLKTFWKPFTNPEFPGWLLGFHWGSILFASSLFLFGYFTRWNKTLLLMTLAYGFMALICAIETFGYMKSENKYWAMAGEYVTYMSILIILYKSEYFVDFFYR